MRPADEDGAIEPGNIAAAADAMDIDECPDRIHHAVDEQQQQQHNKSKEEEEEGEDIEDVSNSTNQSPRIGQPAPPFTARQYLTPDGNLASGPLSLDQLRGGGYLLLVFYPLDFTFVCPTELIELESRYDDFKKLGCEVVVISQDSQYCHLHWSKMERSRGGLVPKNSGQNFRLTMISDMDKSIMRSYGVLDEESGVSLRGTFLVDGNGVLRHYHVNDLPVGRSADECLRLVEAFQHVDKHGHVCPQGWKQGQRTIDTSQADSFFAETYS